MALECKDICDCSWQLEFCGDYDVNHMGWRYRCRTCGHEYYFMTMQGIGMRIWDRNADMGVNKP